MGALIALDRRCTATSKRSGERCRRAAIVGGTVCKVHGGGAPQVAAAAVRRSAEADARATLAALVPDDVEPTEDVLGAIAQLCGELVTAREAAASMVRRLDALADPRTGAAAPEVALWLALVDKSTRALEAAARLNIGERQVALGKAQAQIIAAMFRQLVGFMVGRMRAGDTPDVIEGAWPSFARELLEEARTPRPMDRP